MEICQKILFQLLVIIDFYVGTEVYQGYSCFLCKYPVTRGIITDFDYYEILLN